MYADFEAYHKQRIIIAVCEPVERWSGEQNAFLRRGDAGLLWETEILKGKLQDHVREVIQATRTLSGYEGMGIETDGPQIPAISAQHPRVLSSDDHCNLLWDLGFAVAKNRRQRLLQLSDGYPRRWQQ